MEDKSVDILLATYNGSEFIVEQIESILKQSYKNIRLLIRDDGSTDNTFNIAKKIASLDARVVLIVDYFVPNGPGENFKRLIQASDADYVLFSDQDDVWFENKVELLVNYAEKHFKSELALVSSPGLVVDEKLKILKGRVTRKSLNIERVNDLLCGNGGIQGCSLLVTRGLCDASIRMKDSYWYMHDYIITLYAACFGEIHDLPVHTFLYRQHSNNVLGYNNTSLYATLKRLISNVTLLERRYLTALRDFIYTESDNISELNFNLITEFLTVVEQRNKIKISHYFIKNKLTVRKSVVFCIIKVFLCRKIVD
ncbi:MAG: glycosyltransferase [Aeromonas sp.]